MAGIYEVVREAADQAIRETALDDILSEHRKLRAALERVKVEHDEWAEATGFTGIDDPLEDAMKDARAVLAEVGER